MYKAVSSAAAVAVLIALLGSCVSIDDRMMTPQEKAEYVVIDTVTANYTRHQFFHIRSKNRIKEWAYDELMSAAQRQYEGNIDIRNIKIKGSSNKWTAPDVIFNLAGSTFIALGIVGSIFGSPMVIVPALIGGVAGIGNTQTITATADVVLLDGIVIMKSQE